MQVDEASALSALFVNGTFTLSDRATSLTNPSFELFILTPWKSAPARVYITAPSGRVYQSDSEILRKWSRQVLYVRSVQFESGEWQYAVKGPGSEGDGQHFYITGHLDVGDRESGRSLLPQLGKSGEGIDASKLFAVSLFGSVDARVDGAESNVWSMKCTLNWGLANEFEEVDYADDGLVGT